MQASLSTMEQEREPPIQHHPTHVLDLLTANRGHLEEASNSGMRMTRARKRQSRRLGRTTTTATAALVEILAAVRTARGALGAGSARISSNSCSTEQHVSNTGKAWETLPLFSADQQATASLYRPFSAFHFQEHENDDLRQKQAPETTAASTDPDQAIAVHLNVAKVVNAQSADSRISASCWGPELGGLGPAQNEMKQDYASHQASGAPAEQGMAQAAGVCVTCSQDGNRVAGGLGGNSQPTRT